MRILKVLGPAVVLCVFVAISSAKPLPKGRWSAILVEGGKWTLPLATEKDESTPDRLTIEVAEIRTIGDAKVVRMSYETEGGEDDSHDLPDQIAITKKGVYFFAGYTKDDEIARAVKKKPMFADGGKPSKWGKRKDGTWAMVPADHPEAVCYGFGADPSCGAAPCDAWLCLDETGIVAAGDVGIATYGFEFRPGMGDGGP
jgi:hypothetical protein